MSHIAPTDDEYAPRGAWKECNSCRANAAFGLGPCLRCAKPPECLHCGPGTLDPDGWCWECGHRVRPPVRPTVLLCKEADVETARRILAKTASAEDTTTPKTCPRCGGLNRRVAVYCARCGTQIALPPLAILCPTCGLDHPNKPAPPSSKPKPLTFHCPACDGRGWVRERYRLFRRRRNYACGRCKGRGTVAVTAPVLQGAVCRKATAHPLGNGVWEFRYYYESQLPGAAKSFVWRVTKNLDEERTVREHRGRYNPWMAQPEPPHEPKVERPLRAEDLLGEPDIITGDGRTPTPADVEEPPIHVRGLQ